MQELLGRLGALDPQAGQGLRVIACFDELMTGGVAVRGLLAAAAALTGTTAGTDLDGVPVRIDPTGAEVPGKGPGPRLSNETTPEVWIERDPDRPHANDAIVLERLGLAVGLRLDPRQPAGATPRDLALAVDPDITADERQAAAERLRLAPTGRYRVLAAPLFATWERHPRGPEDVISTPFGPVHLSIIPEDAQALGAPLGLGVATRVEGLPRAAATAVIALRLHTPQQRNRPMEADSLGGLVEMLAELPAASGDRDAEAMARVMEHAWGDDSVAALVDAATVREAARLVGVHHSTMTARVEAMTEALGFDPLSGLGRTRLGMAYLRWRLRTSHVLTLPTPT